MALGKLPVLHVPAPNGGHADSKNAARREQLSKATGSQFSSGNAFGQCRTSSALTSTEQMMAVRDKKVQASLQMGHLKLKEQWRENRSVCRAAHMHAS